MQASIYSSASPFSRFLLWGFGALPGFACVRLVGFKPFWPPALVQQAPPAIILAALRRFRGPALFHGPRPSSRLGAPFWPSGLTLRSSGLAFSQPLTLAVSPITRFMRAATYSSAPPCSKGFQAFWASSACAASATSYHSCSAAPLPWPSAFSWAAPVFKAGRSLLAFGSNCQADPPSAGGLLSFVSVTTETLLYFAHAYSNGIQFLKRCSALGLSFLWASPAGVTLVFSLFGL
jgi:hypothetical protein